MISCFVEYEIDRTREAQFEQFCRLWLDLTPRFGGIHHGYFLPGDGPSDRALALFSFDSMAAPRHRRGRDPLESLFLSAALALSRTRPCPGGAYLAPKPLVIVRIVRNAISRSSHAEKYLM
jgi:hypothetical protein